MLLLQIPFCRVDFFLALQPEPVTVVGERVALTRGVRGTVVVGGWHGSELADWGVGWGRGRQAPGVSSPPARFDRLLLASRRVAGRTLRLSSGSGTGVSASCRPPPRHGRGRQEFRLQGSPCAAQAQEKSQAR